MSGGNISNIDKAQFRKPALYIECIKHNRQLKANFLAGKQDMKQYPSRTFLVYHYFMPGVVDKLLFLPITYFSVLFSKALFT